MREPQTTTWARLSERVTIRTNPASPHPATGGATRLRSLRIGRRTRGAPTREANPEQERLCPWSNAQRWPIEPVSGRRSQPIKLPLLCAWTMRRWLRCHWSPSTVRTSRRCSPAATAGTRGRRERSAALALPSVSSPAPLSVATRALGRLPLEGKGTCNHRASGRSLEARVWY